MARQTKTKVPVEAKPPHTTLKELLAQYNEARGMLAVWRVAYASLAALLPDDYDSDAVSVVVELGDDPFLDQPAGSASVGAVYVVMCKIEEEIKQVEARMRALSDEQLTTQGDK